jgi:hypothetical protein
MTATKKDLSLQWIFVVVCGGTDCLHSHHTQSKTTAVVVLENRVGLSCDQRAFNWSRDPYNVLSHVPPALFFPPLSSPISLPPLAPTRALQLCSIRRRPPPRAPTAVPLLHRSIVPTPPQTFHGCLWCAAPNNLNSPNSSHHHYRWR